MPDSGEFQPLRERIARALYDNGNITDKGWEDGDPADRGVAYEQADVALAALGLEQVGWARPGSPPHYGGRIWPIDKPPLDDDEQAIYTVDSGRSTHTRTSTPQGPDYCLECSETARDWVKWPCPPMADRGRTEPSDV